MWTEPKTDWASTDYINFSDYNRIKNNIAYLENLAFLLYPSFSCVDMGNDKSAYSDFPYAEEFNALENNLDIIRAHTYSFFGDESKQWYPNNRTPTYEDLNRLENACRRLFDGLQKQADMKRRLSFKLGSAKGINI